jgi:hypothetical protein
MQREANPAPDFVIVGAMKCATSTLHDQLARQPGVFMSTPKEPCFFSDEPIWARGEAWYDSLFTAAPEGALRGESSTHYTKLPDLPHAAERLHARRPDARLIYVVRHPIDRLVSHFIHDWTEGICSADLGEALRTHRPLVDYGRYAMQLRPWLERFGADRILLVPYAGIRARPQAELERIAAFLGIDAPVRWTEELEARNVSSERLRKSRWRDLLVNPAPLAWLRRTLVPKAVRERVKSRWRMERRPQLSATQRRDLARIFDEDLADLGRWTGRPLRCDGFDESLLAAPLSWTPSAPRPCLPAGCLA